jgi:integrase
VLPNIATDWFALLTERSRTMRRQEIANLSLPPGKSEHFIPDGTVPGLALRLRASGGRTWVFGYRLGAKQRRLTVGSAAAVSVQEARRLATQLYAKVKLGIDVAQGKEDAKLQAAETVKAKLPLFLARQQERMRDGSLRQRSYIEIERHLLVHAKRLHSKALGEVTRRDVASLLSSLTETLSGATINRVQSTLQSFFAWCIRQGLLSDNPVLGTERRDEIERKRLITAAELRDIWSALRDDAYGDVMRLLILTGARAREIGGLRWGSEINLETRFITLPPERTKNKRQHEIFLSDSALNILRSRPRLTYSDGTPCALVFGRGKNGFNDWAGSKADLDRRINQARQTAGLEPMPAWVVHDFRRLASTMMHDELKILPHIVEVILGHVGHQGGTAGRYNLSLYRGEKAAALTRWAAYVSSLVGGSEPKVVPLRGA